MFDESYSTFLDLLARQVATALASARAYEQERQRAEALAEIDRVKTTFFSNVSHEFRTPLTLMLGTLEDVLSRSGAQPEDREQLVVGHRNALRLLRLVNTLLDFSRVEAGRAQASYEQTDLAAFTADLASSFRSACEAAGLFLKVDAKSLDQRVYIDPEMWEKIVLNLVSNAFKFTFQGGITVAVRGDGDAAVVEVIDTGVGIPQAELPRIFERFHRVENVAGRTFEGSGIGLTLVRNLVALNGGTVEVESKEGEGTTFAVRLPFGTAHLPADRIAAPRAPGSTATRAEAFVEEALRWLPDVHSAGSDLPPADGEPRGSKARILLVDDNADMRGYLRKLLQDTYAVTTAVDGEEALVLIERDLPDLLLADVMMPRLDGFGLLRAIRTRPETKDLPIILLSARAGDEAKVEGFGAGADDYLVKPFSARELLARVAATLELAQMRQRLDALRASEARLRNVLQIQTVGVMFWGEGFGLTDVNEAFLRMTGFARQEALGKTWAELTPPEFHEASLKAVDEVLTRGETTPYEKQYYRKDGSRWWGLFAARRIGDEVVEFVLDVTERRQAEAAVRESQERFRLLVESVHDYAIFTVDRHGIITSWPAGAVAVFGWSEAEMLGQSADRTFVPEDVANGAPRAEIEMAAREGASPNVRWHLRKDGTRIFIDGSTQPLIDADGNIREFIKIGQDVTERRRVQQALAASEQRLRTLMEGIPQLVWRSSEEGRWTWSSPQWQAFTGQSLEQSMGLGWLDAVHPEDHDKALAAWAQAPAQGALNVEYRVRRASDGEHIWHHTRSLPVRNNEDRIIEWLGTTTDVQQLKELQERQAVMVAELQHRTRNLIAVVRSIAQQTMATTDPTEAFRDEFNHRMAALSRVQGLLSRSDEEPITIESLIRMELDVLGVRNGGDGQIVLDGPPVRLRPTIVQTFALALHELATNARKHGALSREDGRLSVAWRVRDADGEGRRLGLEWIERGAEAPIDMHPERRGYGRELIERALPYALGAKTKYELRPEGVHCTIDLPLEKNESRRRAR